MSKKYLYYFDEGSKAFNGDLTTMKNILGGKGAGLAHHFNFPFRFQLNHLLNSLSRMAQISANTSSMLRVPSTDFNTPLD